ncbi:MAG: DEAD/DEAH box helicase [bacterium]
MNNENLAICNNELSHNLTDFNGITRNVKMYNCMYSQRLISIPYSYGLRKYGYPKGFKYPSVKMSKKFIYYNPNIEIKPRDYQKKCFKAVIESIKKKNTALVELPTGAGKTFICLMVLVKLRTRTIVCVPNNTLAYQWIEEIHKITSGKRTVGINNPNVDICISVINSLSLQKKISTQKYGFIIFDECHKYPTSRFGYILKHHRCKYSLGVTATIEREDGMDKLLKYLLSDVTFKMNSTYKGKTPIVYRYPFIPRGDPYSEPPKNESTNKLDYIKCQEILNTDTRRLRKIINLIKVIYPTRQKILVITRECEYIDLIAGKLDKTHYNYCKLYKGELSVQEAREYKMILATRSSGSVGMDIKDLDTLILTCSFKPGDTSSSLIQVVGRILRKNHKTNPLIFDIQDQWIFYKYHGIKRNEFYKKRGYKIKKYQKKYFQNKK